MILELNHKQAEENLITSNVNLVIKDTLEQTQALEEIVESAPNILKGSPPIINNGTNIASKTIALMILFFILNILQIFFFFY